MDDKAQLGRSESSPSMGGAPRPPSHPSQKPSNAPSPGPTSTSKQIKSWRPSPDLHGSEGLTVPYSGSQPMSRALYESLLEQRLKQLIEEDPEQAQQVLSSDPDNLSDLYQIEQQSPSADWPSQILQCGQMQTLLDQINWKKGTSLQLPQNELPTLDEISQALLQ